MSQTDTTFTYTINEGEPTPEPVIGPGMILERGRERVLIGLSLNPSYNATGISISYRKRRMFGEWPVVGEWCEDFQTLTVRHLLLSGFRVIREADPPAQQESKTP